MVSVLLGSSFIHLPPIQQYNYTISYTIHERTFKRVTPTLIRVHLSNPPSPSRRVKIPPALESSRSARKRLHAVPWVSSPLLLVRVMLELITGVHVHRN